MKLLTREAMPDLLARVGIGALFTLLSLNILSDFRHTGRVTGLMLLASESLVVVLTIVRRRARLVDGSVAAVVVTTLSLAGPPMLRASGHDVALVPDAVTAAMSAVGLTIVVVAKIALGRSFGIVPANRGVVVRGPYTFVRHPIYAGYLITHIGFLIAHPAPWNIAVLLVADTALIMRAMMEERVLIADVQYQSYCQRVGWHLMPGVF